MANKLYIGFGHKARQGKNVVADTIHAQWPALTRVLGLADALKAHCRVAFGMRKKDAPLLQLVGTDLYRRQNANLWCEVLEATAEDCAEPIILVPDVRFPNEADFIMSHEGMMIRIRRLLPDGTQYLAPDRDAAHESETALDNYNGWGLTIDATDGDVEALKLSATALGASIVAAWQQLTQAPRVILPKEPSLIRLR